MGRLAVLHSLQVWLPLTMTWLHTQVRRLPPDIRCEVACDRLDTPERWPGVEIHVLPPRDRWRPWQAPGPRVRARQLARHLRRRRADLVHSHFGNVGWNDAAVVRAASAGHLVSFYGQDLTRFPKADPAWAGRYRSMMEGGATVLCEGPHMAEVARGFGGPTSKVRLHHLGVELDRLPFRPRQWNRGTPLRILMAGSFREKKGLPDALRALGLLAQHHEVEATLIGDAERGRASGEEERRRIDEAAAESGLGPRLRRLGYVPHERMIAEAYDHHLFLSPSVTAADGDTEGGAPVGLIEMAATGMPIVTTTHCDIPHVLPPSYHPLLSPERDPAALHRTMERLVADPGSWAVLAADARARIELEFNARTQADRLAAIYRDVAAEAV